MTKPDLSHRATSEHERVISLRVVEPAIASWQLAATSEWAERISFRMRPKSAAVRDEGVSAARALSFGSSYLFSKVGDLAFDEDQLLRRQGQPRVIM